MRRDLLGIGELLSARLRLRPLVAEDADALSTLTNEPGIIAAIPFLAAPFGPAAARELIGGSGARDCFFGAWLRADGALIGVVGAHLRENLDLEIGYWIGSGFERSGLATEAADCVLQWLRTAFPDHHIVAQCRPENRASARVLEKLGLKPCRGAPARSGRVLWELPGKSR